MNGKPLVSAIIIFFNEERFLEEAVESVFHQTYDTWELILVDDGSSDGSPKIARRYADTFPHRVRYVEHPEHQNRGMSASRNLGLRHARGAYIALLDADDVWVSTKIEEQVAILESHPEAAMVYGPLLWWYSWTANTEPWEQDRAQELGVEPDRVVHPPTVVSRFLANEGRTPSGILARREAVERIGGYEESFRGMYEDQVFHVKLALKSPVYVSSRIWYKWRKHPDSCCSVSVRAQQYHQARYAFLEWTERYIRDQGNRDAGLWCALSNALWRYRHPRLYHLQRRAAHSGMQVIERLKRVGSRSLPVPARRWLKDQWRRRQSHVP
ncbi:MAG TPA: glycosyltransferase family A protein [Nitrospiraceae bacterium]|nr:glycosyltransferase family A protein [Nitrospiraceae bacterium]